MYIPRKQPRHGFSTYPFTYCKGTKVHVSYTDLVRPTSPASPQNDASQTTGTTSLTTDAHPTRQSTASLALAYYSTQTTPNKLTITTYATQSLSQPRDAHQTLPQPQHWIRNNPRPVFTACRRIRSASDLFPKTTNDLCAAACIQSHHRIPTVASTVQPYRRLLRGCAS